MSFDIDLVPTKSDDLLQWANLFIALCALIVAVVSIYLTRSSLANQITHNKLSVRPIPYIALSKDSGIAIQLQNHGFGPLKINLFEIVRSGVLLENMVQILPENRPLGISGGFTTGMFERTLPANEQVELITVKVIAASHEALSYLNQVKLNIQDTVIRIGYSDIYGDSFEVYEKELSWLCQD